jgi:protocatechuate 3,4-dioxygenase beta subunit
MTEHPTLSRGALIKAAGGAGLAVAFGARVRDAFGADAATAATCVLTPEVTEGPYWIDNKLTRRDIREGKPGLPLVLAFTVVNAKNCKPINRADVEIWHCDASGNYSGYESGGGPGGGGPGGHATPTSSTRYLRGHQRSNVAGVATFLTVFPGWYPGRTPHIHMKVHVGAADRVVHTGQVFFDEVVQAAVYKHPPYSSHGLPDTSHARDTIYAQAGGSRAVVRLSKRPGGAAGYLGRIVIGVAA